MRCSAAARSPRLRLTAARCAAAPSLCRLQGASTTTRSGTASDSPLALLWTAAGRWASLARGLTLAGLAASGAATAAAGLALLLFLATTAGLAPPRDTFVRPLALDFSQTDLVAQTTLLPAAAAAGYDGLLPADSLTGGSRCVKGWRAARCAC